MFKKLELLDIFSFPFLDLNELEQFFLLIGHMF